MKKIKIGIVGYGGLGHAVEQEAKNQKRFANLKTKSTCLFCAAEAKTICLLMHPDI